MDLRPCAGSSVLDKELTAVCSEDRQARSGGAVAPSEYTVLGDSAETGPWLADWDVICALRTEVL